MLSMTHSRGIRAMAAQIVSFLCAFLRRCRVRSHIVSTCLLPVWLMGALAAQAPPPAVARLDSDADGLSDAMEQALLERFLPRFQISGGECDGKPARFAAGLLKATATERDGTIYGQVTPWGVLPDRRALIEVHFYDLWGKDCGRDGHVLDAEHVSVLLSAARADAPVENWRALYWFAAAHEATMCDMSQVATGEALGAERRGPEVWISAGKHAAYLAETICNGGCGADRCERTVALQPARVVNLGEAGAPMNDAAWVADPRWPMEAKLGTDFPPAALARLEKQQMGEPVQMNGARPSVKGTIYVANATYGGLAMSAARTSGALGTADDHTEGALEISAVRTGGALRSASGGTVNAVGASARGVGSALGKAGRWVTHGSREKDATH